jgi:Protein of unknown function (DUF3311)
MRPAASPPQRWRATATVPIPVVRRHGTDNIDNTGNTDSTAGTGGRSRWHWLLAVPAVVPLLTPLFNRTEPALAGIPFFYWCQLAFVGLVVGVVTLVYQATEGAASRRAASRRDRP